MSKTHNIVLGGVTLVPDLSGALYVPAYETLIISDLHLEQGTSLARRGVHVPPYDTAITLKLLGDVVQASAPKRLIFLGDSFHDGEGELRLEETHLEILRRLTRVYETVWISGNHDPQPPQGIGGQGVDFLNVGPLNLRHEPSLLLNGASEIAGHLHPGCGLNQRGRRLYGKCFVGDDKRLILPAFGAYTGGLAITSRAFAGLLNEPETHAWMIGQNAIHRFPLARLQRRA